MSVLDTPTTGPTELVRMSVLDTPTSGTTEIVRMSVLDLSLIHIYIVIL